MRSRCRTSEAEHVQEAVGAACCAHHTCTYLEAGIYQFPQFSSNPGWIIALYACSLAPSEGALAQAQPGRMLPSSPKVSQACR